MAKRITVYDIAESLDISPSTVSRVLNGSTLIGDDTSRRIREKAEELGYVKRRIRRHETRAILNIALFLPHSQVASATQFYNISELLRNFQNGFGDTRINVITVLNDGDPAFFKQKKLGDIDGCVFAFTTPGRDALSVLNQRQIPYLLLNRSDESCNYITLNNKLGMKQLFDFALQGRENRSFCFIGSTSMQHISDLRLEGLREVAAAYENTMQQEQIFLTDAPEQAGERVLDKLLERQCSTVFCYNDLAASSLLLCALARGISVPGELAICGFDNSPFTALLPMKLTTVDLPVSRMALEAGKWLKTNIINQKHVVLQDELEGGLIKGETGGFPLENL